MHVTGRVDTTIVSALQHTHWAPVAYGSESVTVAFYSAVWISTEVLYLQRSLVVIWLVPRETAAVSVHGMCTPYNHAPVSFHAKPHALGACVFSYLLSAFLAE